MSAGSRQCQSLGLTKALAAAWCCTHVWAAGGGGRGWAVWRFPLEKACEHSACKKAKFAESTTAGLLWVGEKVLPGIPDTA